MPHQGRRDDPAGHGQRRPRTVEVHDFKSGKLREDSSDYGLQLDLYSLGGLLKYPTAKRAKTSLVFIDHGKVVPIENEYTQKDVKTLTKAWETRVKRMLNDTQFKPTPGNACRWCTFRKSNGGPMRILVQSSQALGCKRAPVLVRWMPHQGKRECARRRGPLERGML